MQTQKTPLSHSLEANVEKIKEAFGGSFDLLIRHALIKNTPSAFILLDGMCDELRISAAVIKPLTEGKDGDAPLTETIRLSAYKGTDVKEVTGVEEVCTEVIAGNIVLLCGGELTAFSFGAQGFAKKGIEEPQTEQNEKGSQEGFTDNFKDNASLLRRRLRTPELIIERLTAGKTSNTPVLVCSMKGRADEKMLTKIKDRINTAGLDTVFGSGYIRPFLDGTSPSFFSDSGITERPDMLAAKLAEGRIGIIVDGTPFAIIVPYLLADYFHSLDDYLSSPYYAFFIRVIRFVCFAIAVTLPGLFVAICLFHPEILPGAVMYDIAAEEAQTPFPIMTEAITIHLIYEIVREAGLRMPRATGHAVSIVGALVIGDAAVTAGLIAAPMLIIVALTTVCSSVVARLHEPVAVMRFLFILAGGTTGLYGIFAGIGLLLADLCSSAPYDVPFSAPFSPFSVKAQSDALFRAGWKKLGKIRNGIKELEF